MSMLCQHADCDKDASVRGYCKAHYLRLRKAKALRMNTEVLFARGRKIDHPLYARWNKLLSRRELCAEWSDFWTFVDQIGDIPEGASKLTRPNETLPLGPSNFRWLKKLEGEERNAYYRNWYRTSKSGRGRRWQQNYGISYKEYHAMFEAQGGVCAICGLAESSRVRRDGDEIRLLAVDHDHETKAVRGILCGSCNKGIGLLRDDEKTIESALAYIRKWKATC